MRTSSPQAIGHSPADSAPDSCEALRERLAAEPGSPSQRAWRRLNLVYLVFVFLPLVWARGEMLLALGATLLAVALFLPVYWKGYELEGRAAWGAALAMAALGFALTPWNPGGNTFLVYAFASLGFSQPWRAAVGGALLLMLLYAGWLLALGLPIPFAIGPVIIGGAVLVGAILGRREMQRNERLRLTQAEVERLARVAERERIARDLHDLLGHTLSVVAMKSELARKLAERDGSAAAAHIGEVEQVAREALKQVREAVSGMRSAQLAVELVNARLAALAVGLEFEARVDPLPPLDAAQENALAMALREAVTNVLRHAEASRIEVELAREGRELRLCVQDDGRGCRGAPGNGLSGMRERAGALGGRVLLEVPPGAGRGTRLRFVLPVDGRRAGEGARA